MDDLLFPMFSKITKHNWINPANEDIFDTSLLKLDYYMTRTNEFDDYQYSNDINVWKFLPCVPKTCLYGDIVTPDRWQYFFPHVGGEYSVLSDLDQRLKIQVGMERFFGIDFHCVDCMQNHYWATEYCDITYVYKFKHDADPETFYESFPNGMAFIGNPQEILETRKDYSIENDLIRMLDEDLEHEKSNVRLRRNNPVDQNPQQDDSVDDRWFSDRSFQLAYSYLVYMVRNFTLSEHLELFFGKTSVKTDDTFENTLLGHIMRDTMTKEATEALINHIY